MNEHVRNEGDTALNSSHVLLNYGGDQNNNFLNMFEINDDNPFKSEPSLYYDIDGMSKALSRNSQSLSLLSINIQSIKSKFPQLRLLIENLKQNGQSFDVICLQETWLTDDDDFNMFNFDGYVAITKSLQPTCSKHGGLITYIKDSITVSGFEKIINYKNFEGLAVTLNISNKKMTILNVYRPPSNNERTMDSFITEYFP